MLKLTPTPALKDGSFKSHGISIALNSDLALASLAQRSGQETGFTKASTSIFGGVLPDVERVQAFGDFTAFWTGPEAWMVSARVDKFEDLEAVLKAQFKETASITEQSGGWVCFDVTGAQIHDLMERLVMADLRTTGPDYVKRCVIDHIGVFVLTSQEGLRLWAPRSFASSLFHALTQAAKSL